MLKITDSEFTSLITFVYKNYGIDLSKKRVLIEGRMSNIIMQHGFTTFKEYLDFLFADKSGNELTTLVNKLTTNFTYFMRENEHFEFLASTVLPELEKVRPSKKLYIWSAGCSSGQEPYTLAMALDQYFGSRKTSWDTVILASDISINVLEKAKAGIYTEDEIKDVPDNWRTKYFVKLGNGSYQVCKKIRKEVVFKVVNLMDPFNFKNCKKFDLILCRNVMIYFDSPTKKKLVEKYFDWSAEGAYLFIGHSESLAKEATRFTYVQPAIYQKRSGTV